MFYWVIGMAVNRPLVYSVMFNGLEIGLCLRFDVVVGTRQGL